MSADARESYRYRAFGYALESDQPLALREDAREDAPGGRWVVRADDGTSSPREPAPAVLHDVLDEPGGQRLRVTFDAGEMAVRYSPWTLRVQAGAAPVPVTKLRYYEDEGAPHAPSDRGGAFGALLERVVLPIYVLLHRAHAVVLHGNALVLDGRAWIFLGESGAGKSTTALELLHRGALLLADDRVPVDVENCTATEGPCSLRLGDDVGTTHADAPSYPDGKRALRVASEALAAGSFPIAGLVFLEPLRDTNASDTEDRPISLAPLDPPALLLRLMHQSFDLTHPPPDLRGALFRRLSALARRVRGYRCVLEHGSAELRARQMDRLAALLTAA